MKKSEQLQKSLEDQNEFLRSLLASLEDIKEGRMSLFKFPDEN